MKQGVDSLAQWEKLTFDYFHFAGAKNKLYGNQKKMCGSQISGIETSQCPQARVCIRGSEVPVEL